MSHDPPGRFFAAKTTSHHARTTRIHVFAPTGIQAISITATTAFMSLLLCPSL